MSPLLTALRFSPRPNRASEIHWHEWGDAVFREAERRDLPILLHLVTAWCHWCHVVDETTLSDPEVIAFVNESFVPLRADGDRHPHVRDRYIAGGWPTTAFLTPDGEVLWSGSGLEAHELLHVGRGVLRGWAERREELRSEVERRRMAIEASGRRRGAAGLVRREFADNVLTVLVDSADARNGGFGDAPRFPAPEAVELLFTEGVRAGNVQLLTAAERNLDGMLAGELFDRVEGGFFRYALEPDWTQPQHEKLLSVNAGLVRIYALGAALTGRADLRDAVDATVEWANRSLGRKDGLWACSQDAEAEYYALGAEARQRRGAPVVEPTAYVDANAAWIAALAEAGGRLGRDEWGVRAATALDALYDRARDEAGRVLHALDGPPGAVDLLTDLLGLGGACVAVAQATGAHGWIERAQELVSRMQQRVGDDDGAFRDVPRDAEALGALRYRERPFDLNAAAARLLLDLHQATGDRSYRAMAERVLAVLSPRAGRHGTAAASFALAVGEYFEPPLQVFLVGSAERTAPLRCRARALPYVDLRVWTLEAGGRAGERTLPPDPAPAAYVCGAGRCSSAVTEPEALAAAADSVH